MDDVTENQISSNQTSLFERLFSTQFQYMPKPWRIFHSVVSYQVFEGETEVIRGTNIILRVLAALLRLPPTSKVPVKLVIEQQGLGESWSRYFGQSFFSTFLYMDEGQHTQSERFYLKERYGLLTFGVVLTVEDETVFWGIERWWILGMPLPTFLAPLSQTKEFIDKNGRYAFDINLVVPLQGLLIAYRGWLKVE